MRPSQGPLGRLFMVLRRVIPCLAALSCLGASPFRVRLDRGTVISLKGPGAQAGTEYLAPGRRLGDAALAYRVEEGEWCATETASAPSRSGEPGRRTVALGGSPSPLILESGFRLQGGALVWTLTLRNATAKAVEVGDLALPLPLMTDFGRGATLGKSVLKHSFISGSGSFLFWMRPDSARPFLTLTPTGDTSLEYWDMEGGYRVFIHAARTLQALAGSGTWRQPGTSLRLAPAGTPGDAHTYGFTFRWADGYEGVRRILLEEGKVDVKVAPGMTVPSDLSASIALRSREPIRALEAEFPESTRIEAPETRPDGTRIYRVHFGRLGENRLTVKYGDGRWIHLEFFSTEPLETLIRKRGAFIAGHRFQDPSKWYDGLLAEWNMASGTLLGPDNHDHIQGWRVYELSCDDPGLSKPAFLASKLAEYPVQAEVDALDYYVQHFVWGGLQKTLAEDHPYGIYGIPDWKRLRDSLDPGSMGKEHLWRVYDYPHIAAMYLGLYRVARDHPWIRTSLPARDYLKRAYGTLAAMFTVPMAIEGWSAYETGFYNEIIAPDLIRELDGNGMTAEAADLRGHWERKVRSFVYGTPDLFGSEYPFDSTGFESTHAFATYALEASASPDPRVRAAFPAAGARAFLEREMAANLFCRGVLEPAYYLLGSDYRGTAGNAFTLSYMSPMGGGSILDNALRQDRDPEGLRLGYASLLSSWALMNTGTPESGYGYWFPGKANDGGAGGGFEPAARGTTWLGQPHHRGSWYYSCESDLGYCGYLRNAATILTLDPLFGRFCFGGLWTERDGGLEVRPRDGVRRRFHALLGDRKLHLLLDNDRFAGALWMTGDLTRCRFTLESDNPAPHRARLRLSGEPGTYVLTGPQGPLPGIRVEPGRETRLELPLEAGASPDYTLTRTGP